MKRLPLTILLVVACGKPSPRVEVPPLPHVARLADTYRELLPSIQDDNGWFNAHDCDALLFNSLASAGGAVIEIVKARDDETHQWYRTPDKDCHPDRSASDISRDMLLGLMWHIWKSGEFDLGVDLWNYGVKNKWVMGRGPLTRTLFTPTLRDTLARMIGEGYRAPEVFARLAPGFGRHLQVVHILLRGEVTGQLSAQSIKRLEEYYEEESSNILFQAANGVWVDRSTHVDISHYPKDRLATTGDWCEAWPPQRSADDSGREPCRKGKIHSGGEILFIDQLIKG